MDRLEELYALCDLVRIIGVCPQFARILYEAGVVSVIQFADTDHTQLYRSCMAIIRARKIPGAHFVQDDMLYCIHYARILNELTGDSQ